MLETLNNIRSTGDILGASLDQYVALCSTLESHAHPIPESLSHLIDDEFAALDSIEMRLRKARFALGSAKNRSPALVPINKLPPEILTRIFGLVLDASRRDYDQPGGTVKCGFPKYPDVFLYVCSHWRQIATSTAILWSHIDIISRYVHTKGILTRAKTLVTLAGQYLLNLHIIGATEQGLDVCALPNTSALFQFFSDIAPRIQSLKLITFVFSSSHLSMLQTCLVHCTPGVLTELIIRPSLQVGQRSEPRSGFLEARGEAELRSSWKMNIQQDQLEALLVPIKVLHLRGIYLRWSSKAYHGLAELRLLSVTTDTPITITEAQFVGILESSPQLRILHFDIEIEESLPKDAAITPVHLNSLEVLDISLMRPELNGTMLRWLATGTRPLTVGFCFNTTKALLSDDETKRFFSRSYTTKLTVTSNCVNDWPPHLLSLSPYLEILALRFRAYESINSVPFPFPEEYVVPPISFHPDSLHVIMLPRIFDLGWLLQVLERRPIRMITICGGRIMRNKQIVPHNEIEDALLQLCPVVRILGANEPSPILDWDVLTNE